MDATPQPYRQIVYEYLVDQISSQIFRVGDKLNEREIAQKLGISRTPVREAIHMLELEGWVTVLPRTGTVVNGLTARRIEEVFQVRMSLEMLAVGLLCDRISAPVLETLRQLVQEQKRFAHRESQEFIRLDREFHNHISTQCGNALLQEMLAKINSPLMRIEMQWLCDSNRYGWSIREHCAIVDALTRGHRREAVRAMQRHIERTWLNVEKQLAKTKPIP